MLEADDSFSRNGPRRLQPERLDVLNCHTSLAPAAYAAPVTMAL